MDSDPDGAAVLLDGKAAGITPCSFSLSRSRKRHVVKIEKPGFETAETAVRSRLNGWVFGNLVVGGLVGVVVDLSTGGFYRYSPTKISVKLAPEAKPEPEPPRPGPEPEPPGPVPEPPPALSPEEVLANIREGFSAGAMTRGEVREEVSALDIPAARKAEFLSALGIENSE